MDGSVWIVGWLTWILVGVHDDKIGGGCGRLDGRDLERVIDPVMAQSDGNLDWNT